jgi:hypothetical protein
MSLIVQVGAEWVGKKAIGDADKGISTLTNSAKKLAGALGVALSAKAVADFGKAAVKAFVEDEKSAALLANTVKNLGLSFETPALENFINKLSMASGVADDELRPAMQNLLTTTGSVTKSQELLNQAIEISRGSGIDLNTVVSDLNNAYVGNTKGLKKYYLGLTQTELKTKSFAEIQAALNKQFNGASAAYLETYAGKMQKLNTAAGEAKETIGQGIVTALSILGGDGVNNIDGATSAMQRLATATSETLVGQATFWDKLFATAPGGAIKKAAGYAGVYFAEIFGITASRELAQTALNPATGYSTIDNYNMSATAKQQAAARKKAEDAAAKRARDLAKISKQQLVDKKKELALKKAGTIFDLEQIQLIAALKNNLSEEEQRRIKLQLALITENTSEAAKLTYELAKAQGLGEQMARNLASLPDAKNPFASWSAYLDMIIEKARQAAAAGNGGSVAAPSSNAAPFIPDMSGAAGYGGTGTGQGGSVLENYRLNQIVVQIDGKEVATAVQNQNNSGNFTGFSRLGDFKTL